MNFLKVFQTFTYNFFLYKNWQKTSWSFSKHAHYIPKVWNIIYHMIYTPTLYYIPTSKHGSLSVFIQWLRLILFSYPKPYPEFLTQRNIVYIILLSIYRVSYCTMYPFISLYPLITYSDNQTDPYRICVVKTGKTDRQLIGFDDPWRHGYGYPPNHPWCLLINIQNLCIRPIKKLVDTSMRG